MPTSIRYISIRKDKQTIQQFHDLVRVFKLSHMETSHAYIWNVTDNTALADDMVKGKYGNATELTQWLGE